MKRIAHALALTLWIAAPLACGPAPGDDGSPGGGDDTGNPDVDPRGPLQPDELVGEELPPADDGAVDDDPPVEDAAPEASVDTLAAGGPAAGAHMITTAYVALHKSASSTSALVSVPPHNGVHDSGLHLWGNKNGLIPPGHTVTLLDAVTHNGFSKVKYEGKTGFVSHSHLLWKKPGLSHIALAMENPNAFYKNQLHRSRFNKDGPSTSGNCAPTSLAMAALVMGDEPAGLSVEESIHRVRAKYDPGLHETRGSTRAQIKSAATALGLHVHGMATHLAPAAALARVDDQLEAGRVVVLIGAPGKPGSAPSAYQAAFNHAYADAIAAGQTLRHSHYTFDGGHAIFVLGKRANGKYEVGDPISEVGFVRLTAAQLKDFMSRYGGGTGIAVWK